MDIQKKSQALLKQIDQGDVNLDELKMLLQELSNDSVDAVSYKHAFTDSPLFQFVLDKHLTIVEANANARSVYQNLSFDNNMCSMLGCINAGADRSENFSCKNCILNNIAKELCTDSVDILPLKDTLYITTRQHNASLYKLHCSFFKTSEEKQVAILLEDITAEQIQADKTQTDIRVASEAERLAHFGRWEFDIVKNSFTLSDEGRSIFNLPERDQILSLERFYSFVIPEDVEKVKNDFVYKLKTQKCKPVEFRIHLPDGRLKHVVVEGDIHPDEMANRQRFVGFMQDITNYKTTQETLIAREKKLRYISELSSDYTYSVFVNKNFIIDWVSGAFNTITGFTPAEVQTMPNGWISAVHPHDVMRVTSVYRDAMSKGEAASVEYRIITKQGETKWIADNFKPIWNPALNKVEQIIGSVQDITLRKHAEKKLIHTNEQLEAIYDSAPLLLMLINENREIVRINNHQSNFQLAKFITKSGRFSLHGDAVSQDNAFTIINDCIDKAFLKGENTDRLETEIKIDVGGKIESHTFLVSTTLLNKSQNMFLLVGFDDITNRKKMENELVEAKELAEKSDRLKTAFLNNLSHEVRTPLNSIIGFSRFMRDGNIDDEKRKLYANTLIDSSNRLLKIILDIVYVSRLETGIVQLRKEAVNAKQILFNLVSLHQEEINKKGLELKYPVDCDNSIYFESDSGKLLQVLDNFLQNAIKFTSKGTINVDYEIDDERITFSVSDTGIGIDEENFKMIFDRFTQVDYGISRKYGGNGLGLSISQSIADLMDGQIIVESEPGKGSCFSLSIPFITVNKLSM